MCNEDLVEALTRPVREAEERGQQQMLSAILAYLCDEERGDGLSEDMQSIVRSVCQVVAGQIEVDFAPGDSLSSEKPAAEKVWVLVGTIAYETSNEFIGVYRTLGAALRAGKERGPGFNRIEVVEQLLDTDTEKTLSRTQVF